MTKSFTIRPDESFAHLICLLSLVAAGCAIVFFRSSGSDLAGAFYGWSPTTLMGEFWRTSPFLSRNYPGGEEELLKSAIYLPMPLIGKLGFSRSFMSALLISMEVIALAIGAAFAVRKLVTGSSMTEATFTAIFLIAGTLASGNLARWGQPYYGSVYNFASGAGLAGTAFLLSGSIKRGSSLIAISYVIHPILGFFFACFAAAGVLSYRYLYPWKALATGLLIFFVIAGGWTFLSMRSAELSGGSIPPEAFVSITKMMGYHWYPISHGVFGSIAYERFVPFLSTSVLIALYLFRAGQLLARIERQVAVGLAALGLITLIGIFVAEYSQTPFLIKLALHRASMVFLLFGALFVAPGLLRDVSSGSWLQAPFAAAVLASVFVDPYGPPFVLSLLLAGIAIGIDLGNGRRPQPVLLIAIIALVVAMIWLTLAGFVAARPSDYFGFGTMQKPLFLSTVALLLLLRLVKLVVFLPAVVACAACLWAQSLIPIPDAATRGKAAAYLDVQRWAKTNTLPEALFMVDPGHAYGWREYSERPSFGSVREWLYAGWIYNSQRKIYDAGIERIAFFGLPVKEVLAREADTPNYGKARMPMDLQKLYYGADGDWFRTAVAKYGIDYFVMDESLAKDVPGLEVVYRNAGYTIRRAVSAGTQRQ